MHSICECQSPLGPLTLASDGRSLTGLWMVGQKYYGQTLPPDATPAALPLFEQVQKWLDRYFAGENPPVTFPLDPQGSQFRQDVWTVLRAIPYGEVTTYGEIAKKIAHMRGLASMSAQAVGGAVGHNHISILIPCHRVVGSTGGMTGFAGGIEKKEWLLRLERADKKTEDHR